MAKRRTVTKKRLKPVPIVINKPPIVTPANVPVVDTDFNGGRSQINFWFLQFGGDYPFINAMKGGSTWNLVDTHVPPQPSTLDTNGYPTSISDGGLSTLFFIPSASDRPGNWRLKWDGSGTIFTTGLGTVSGANGDYTFAPGTTAIVLRITASTTLTNIRYFHADDEAALNAGGVFSAPFKAKLLLANFGVYRFLDWQLANVTNCRYWADRRPTGYAMYYGDELRPSIYGGITTHIVNAYSVTAPSGWDGLVDKAIVTVRWDNTATSTTPTLNVGGTGAKTIGNEWGAILADPDNLPVSGKYATLVFDSDLNVWCKFGGDSSDVFLNNGVPPELCFQLCEEMGAHPWFCPPFLSCDPITDWITGLATYCRDNQPSWMIPRYEVIPNETWNPGFGFYATPYAKLKAFVHWGSLDYNNWVGKVASTGGQAVSAVYAADRSKYETVLGVQTLSFGNSDDRLNSPDYVADGGSAAKNWVTAICVTGYFQNTYSDALRTSEATAYAAGNTAQKLVIATNLVNSVTTNDTGEPNHIYSLPNYLIVYNQWKPWATALGVTKMFQYEGGWDAFNQGNANYEAMTNGAKSVASLQTHLTTNYTDFLSAGGLFPSCYMFAGDAIWSINDPDIYATESPQFTAIKVFNS